eukprot:5793736-Prymnesium_polylepis.2
MICRTAAGAHRWRWSGKLYGGLLAREGARVSDSQAARARGHKGGRGGRAAWRHRAGGGASGGWRDGRRPYAATRRRGVWRAARRLHEGEGELELGDEADGA